MLRLVGLSEKKEFKTKDIVRLETSLGFVEGVAPDPPQAGPGATPPAPDFIGPPAPKSASKNYGGVVQFDNDDGKPKSPTEIWLEGRVKEKFGEDGTKAEAFLQTLRGNIPQMMLACVPLFAFVLQALYIRHRRYYVEHLVYALHIHTFVYVAVVVITIISMGTLRVLPAVQPLVVLILSIAAMVQVFLSIRRVYKQGWIKTTIKFAVRRCGLPVCARDRGHHYRLRHTHHAVGRLRRWLAIKPAWNGRARAPPRSSTRPCRRRGHCPAARHPCPRQSARWPG